VRVDALIGARAEGDEQRSEVLGARVRTVACRGDIEEVQHRVDVAGFDGFLRPVVELAAPLRGGSAGLVPERFAQVCGW
jgi:hypothetical protein